jgi:hypothetical protein
LLDIAMPELVLSPSLDLTPWSGESTTTTIYESPMSPTVVKFRSTVEPAPSEPHCASSTTLADKVAPATSLEPARKRSAEDYAVGLTGLSLAKLRMLQSHFKTRP